LLVANLQLTEQLLINDFLNIGGAILCSTMRF
jgi:hypothetical protein